VDIELKAFVNFLLDLVEWSTSHPGRFTPEGKRALFTHRMAAWDQHPI
jgi:hypothetical protein